MEANIPSQRCSALHCRTCVALFLGFWWKRFRKMVLKVFKGGARPVTGTSQVFIGGALPRQIASRYNCTNTAASDTKFVLRGHFSKHSFAFTWLDVTKHNQRIGEVFPFYKRWCQWDRSCQFDNAEIVEVANLLLNRRHYLRLWSLSAT